MDFDNFLSQAWNDHQTDAQAVAGRLWDGAGLIQQNDQIPALVNLATHVFGEHLGRWKDGAAFLGKLRTLPTFVPATNAESAIARSIAVLEVGNGQDQTVLPFGTSDQIRILAVAASALSGQGQSERAQQLFQKALEMAERPPLDKDDPANRALAVTGNNLTCALEEKETRSANDTELMITAAMAARKYWKIAKTWLETKRAEYRLAMSYLKAANLSEASQHAQRCLEIAAENKAAPLEFFFGNEALALVERARGNSSGYSKATEQLRAAFEQLSDDDKSWCRDTLQRFA